MSELIPIFPLQIVLYPGEDLNLHIFEPRYKQLINDCSSGKSGFGMPTVLNGKLAMVGTEAMIKDIINIYPDGKIDLTVTGTRRFSIERHVSTYDSKLYDGAHVTWLEDDMTGNITTQSKMMKLVREIYDALQLSKPGLTDRDDLMAYEVAHYVGMSLEQEYILLTLSSENERQEYLIKFLRKVVPTMHSIERLKERISMNGHFRELDPPDFK